MPIGQTEAREHMSSTLLNPISKTLVSDYLDKEQMASLDKIYAETEMPMWGFQPGKVNTSDWEKLVPGDYAIFVPSKEDLLVTTVVYKARDPKLARVLWGNDRNGNTWELIFFVKILAILQLGKRGLMNKLGYTKEKDYLQGHRRVTEEFIRTYGSVDNFIKSNLDAQVSVEAFSQETAERMLDASFSRREKKEERLAKMKVAIDSTSSGGYAEFRGNRYRRNQLVAKYAKERADYKCEACGFSFTKRDGTKYVEAAHIVALEPQHIDTIDNVRALCANCHKKLDKGNEEARNEVLGALKL